MGSFPRPLDDGLPTIITSRDVRASGLSPERLRAQDLEHLDHGIYLRRDATLRSWQSLGLPEPGHRTLPDFLAALLTLHPSGVLSHETAAHLHGIPMPHAPWLHRDPSGYRTSDLPPVHITVPKGTKRIRRSGVVDHRRKLDARHVTEVHGLRVTTLERTWLDLCALGYPWLLDDLVAAGDHLVKHPWHPGGRLPPLSTVEQIRQAVDQVGQFKGKRLAKDALELVRVGADAAPETKLRLALLRAGLPEPELQCPIDPDDEDSPETDLGYEDCRLAMQYEGAGHRTAEQQTRDVRRDRYAAERGWRTLKANVDDQREGFRSFIRQVRRHRDSWGKT